MAGIQRRAEASWEGGLARGSGTVTGETGALGELAVGWSARVEAPEGKTSPEELLAAAHAACYAMAFSHVLGEGGSEPERLQVSAVVSAELGDEGLKVISSELDVVGRVPGMDAAAFEQAAREADQGCPISNTLRGNIDIRVQARLEPQGGQDA